MRGTDKKSGVQSPGSGVCVLSWHEALPLFSAGAMAESGAKAPPLEGLGDQIVVGGGGDAAA